MPGPGAITEQYVTPDTLDAELAGWMAEVAPYQWRPVTPLVGADAALVVVDMNRPFVDAGYPLASSNAPVIVPRLAAAVEAFRAAGRPVLWVVQGHHSVPHDRGAHLSGWWPTPLLEGTPDVEICGGLSPTPDEKIILKRRYSGFYGTDLEITLRCLGVRQLVIGGVLTHVCPFTTAADAFMRDFDVYYLADGTASLNRDLHVGALKAIAGWCGHVVTVSEVCGWMAV